MAGVNVEALGRNAASSVQRMTGPQRVTLGLAVAATLFAFSTMIAWSYYGLKGVTYLVGESRRAENLFRIVFCAFVAIGCMLQLEAILDFSDALVFLICIPNLLGLYVLAPVVEARLRDYSPGPGPRWSRD